MANRFIEQLAGVRRDIIAAQCNPPEIRFGENTAEYQTLARQIYRQAQVILSDHGTEDTNHAWSTAEAPVVLPGGGVCTYTLKGGYGLQAEGRQAISSEPDLCFTIILEEHDDRKREPFRKTTMFSADPFHLFWWDGRTATYEQLEFMGEFLSHIDTMLRSAGAKTD